MTREQAMERVLDYAYGELSPAEAEAFEAILREDPGLQAELESVTEVQQAASGLERPELPPTARGRILQAARAESRRRMLASRWESLQKMFLSPVLLGATAVIAAVGVGLHLIITQGTDDSWTRADREARMAVLEPAEPAPAAATPPGEPTAAPGDGAAVAVASGRVAVAGEQAPTPQAAAVATAEALSGGAGRTGGAKGKAMLRAAAAPAAPAASAGKARMDAASEIDGLVTGAVGSGYGGGGTGLGGLGATGRGVAVGGTRSAAPSGNASAGPGARAPAPEKAEAPMPAPSSPPMEAPDEFEAHERKAAEEDRDEALRTQDAQVQTAARPKHDRGRFAGPPAKPSPVASAPSPAGDEAPFTPADRVAEARDHRAAGRLAEALAAYRRALAAGLSGDLLADALAEAAEVAKALGRATEADGFLARLERLPGGPARAAKIRAK